MAEIKKFEKPQMEVIKLNSNVGILAGSCGTDGCGTNSSSRELEDLFL